MKARKSGENRRGQKMTDTELKDLQQTIARIAKRKQQGFIYVLADGDKKVGVLFSHEVSQEQARDVWDTYFKDSGIAETKKEVMEQIEELIAKLKS